MAQPHENDCPVCGEPLRPIVRDCPSDLACLSCDYEQNRESIARTQEIADVMIDIARKDGVVGMRFNGSVMTLEIATFANGGLPLLYLMVEQYGVNKTSMPFVLQDDINGLIGKRVVYSPGDEASDRADYLKKFKYFMQYAIKVSRRVSNSDCGEEIDLDLMSSILITGEISDVRMSLPIQRYDERGEGVKKIKVIHSMVDKSSDASRFLAYREVMKEGVELASIRNASSIVDCLRQEFPWFEELNDYVEDELYVRKMGNKYVYIPPILLLGDAGIGKTAYFNKLGELLNVPVVGMDMGGMNSNQVLAGTERGWSEGKPSLAAQTIIDSKIANPLIILDEIDKAGGSDHNGVPHHTLLGFLEKETAVRKYDPYLMGHMDLSYVTWVAIANDIASMSPILLSRFHVIEVSPPSGSDYRNIVFKARKRFSIDYGIAEEFLPVFGDIQWKALERSFSSPRAAVAATRDLLKKMLRRGHGVMQENLHRWNPCHSI